MPLLLGKQGGELQLQRPDGGIRGDVQLRALVDVDGDAGAGNEGEDPSPHRSSRSAWRSAARSPGGRSRPGVVATS